MGNPQKDMENICNAYINITESQSRKMFDHRGPEESNNSYSKYSIPTTTPHKHTSGSYTTSTLSPVESEEEPKKGNISKQRLSDYVKEEIHKATMSGMDYAVMVLVELQNKFHL